MGKFEVIEYVVIKNPNIYYDVYYRLIYKIDESKFRYDMMSNDKNILTEQEFISKFKAEWENENI